MRFSNTVREKPRCCSSSSLCKSLLCLWAMASGLSLVSSFSRLPTTTLSPRRQHTLWKPGQSHASLSWEDSLDPIQEDFEAEEGSSSTVTRRKAVLTPAALALALTTTGRTEAAIAAVAPTPSNDGPIAVIGASGRTGSLCVTACLRRGIPVRALTRTGAWAAPSTPEGAPTTYSGDTQKLLTVSQCDVTTASVEAIAEALKGCAGVIYAASASKAGGTAVQVDNVGVVNVARACLAANVSRYVVLSSTSTTRPKSLGYIFTNLGVGGNIMGEKRNGEVGLMAAYQQQQQSSSSYTIVRPGGLEEPKRNSVLGPTALELSQGDVFAGVISRADVAETTVELARSEAPNLRNTSLELYYRESVVPVEGKFQGLLKKARTDGSPEQQKVALHGTTYPELFASLRPGVDVADE